MKPELPGKDRYQFNVKVHTFLLKKVGFQGFERSDIIASDFPYSFRLMVPVNFTQLSCEKESSQKRLTFNIFHHSSRENKRERMCNSSQYVNTCSSCLRKQCVGDALNRSQPSRRS